MILRIPYRRWLSGLTAWAGGFSALESDDEDHLHGLWTSPDGAAWSRALLPRSVENGWLVALRDHLYLFEFRGNHDPQSVRIRIWRTADGSQWQRQGLFEWHLPRSVGDDWRILIRYVVAAPDRLVMFGVIDSCCGNGGGIPAPARYGSLVAVAPEPVEVPLGGLVIWTSPDGAEWTGQSTEDLRDPTYGDNVELADVAGVPDGVLATRVTDDALLHSPDGSTWESIGPLPPGYWSLSGGLMTDEERVVLAFDADDPHGNDLEVWRASE